VSFALFLLLLLVVTGAVWALEAAWLRQRRAQGSKQPWWVEYSVSFFPVILIVFLLRSFLVEPFKIPSGSMIPTLLVGDFILVNKFAYGIRLPVANVKVAEVGAPQRGDVMVFRYPEDPSLDYIKRVVGAGRPHRVPRQAPVDQRRAGAQAAAGRLRVARTAAVLPPLCRIVRRRGTRDHPGEGGARIRQPRGRLRPIRQLRLQ
jgi:hypothetical protein